MVTMMTIKIIRTYSELVTLPTFEERFEYLRLDGRIGEQTFGFDRYLNQLFYKDKEWLSIRRTIEVKDENKNLLFISPLNKKGVSTDAIRKQMKNIKEELGIENDLLNTNKYADLYEICYY